jgi:hypothetical protein
MIGTGFRGNIGNRCGDGIDLILVGSRAIARLSGDIDTSKKSCDPQNSKAG